jgi:hypothetical protein
LLAFLSANPFTAVVFARTAIIDIICLGVALLTESIPLGHLLQPILDGIKFPLGFLLNFRQPPCFS